MFWYQNVRKRVLSKNLLYDTLPPLSILKNPRWRPRWPRNILNWLLNLYMTYQNTNNKNQDKPRLYLFLISLLVQIAKVAHNLSAVKLQIWFISTSISFHRRVIKRYSKIALFILGCNTGFSNEVWWSDLRYLHFTKRHAYFKYIAFC